MPRLLLLTCHLILAVPALAAAQAPTFRDVTGHDFGQRVTLHHQMARYLERLAAESPRVVLERQGHSWEGRELLLAVVTAPENHDRLDAIRATAASSPLPRT